MSKFRVLIISFFLLAFTTTFVHAKDPEVVTDVYGNELRSGARYYMAVPLASDLIPSVVSDITHGFCPSDVILSKFSNKLPISITPVKYNSTVILEDTYVTVRFNFGYMCRMLISLVWRVDWSNNRVTTGGEERVNRFKLTKYEGEGGSNKYQLAACPVSECLHDCKCEPVGYAEEDNRYLVAGGLPFPIVFVAVKEARIAYKLPSM